MALATRPVRTPEPHGACLVVNNPVSGTRTEEQAALDLEVILELLGPSFSGIEVFETSSTSDGTAWVSDRLDARGDVEVVVACGGDGTVSLMASMVQQRTEKGGPAPMLGLIPRGSGNAIALALGIPTQLPDACKIITDRKFRKLDLAQVADLSDSSSGFAVFPLMLLAGIGLEATTVKNADRELKNRFGPFAYLFAGIRSFARQGVPFQAEFTLEGVSIPVGNKAFLTTSHANVASLQARAITIANAAPPTSVLAQGIGEVRPDDGLLELIVFNPDNVNTSLQTIWSMTGAGLFRRRIASKQVWGLRAKNIKIKCNPPQPIVVDGEMMEIGEHGVSIGLGHPIQVLAPSSKLARKRFSHLARSVRRTLRNVRGVALFAAAAWLMKQRKLRAP